MLVPVPDDTPHPSHVRVTADQLVCGIASVHNAGITLRTDCFTARLLLLAHLSAGDCGLAPPPSSGTSKMDRACGWDPLMPLRARDQRCDSESPGHSGE